MLTLKSFSVTKKTPSEVTISVEGLKNPVTLTLTCGPRVLLVNLPFALSERLGAKEHSYAILKRVIREAYGVSKVETRTAPDPRWVRADANRQADAARQPVSV